ncbi:MAG: ArnT family glycosyltransferase [Anaerolineales bacterium]
MTKSKSLVLGGLILLLAAVLRLPNVWAAYPYTAYVDEGNYLWTARFLYGRGGWDPQSYMYPSLPIYAAVAAAGAADLVRAARGLPLIRAGAAAPYGGNYDPFDPPEFLLAARVACFLAALGVVGLTGWLAQRWRGPAAGLFAALIAALTPALIARGGIAIVDVWSALFVTACLVASDRLYDADGKRTRTVLLAGFLAGCAGASKYQAALVACVPLLAIVVTRRGRAEAARQLATLGLGALVGAFLAMPALWLRMGAVLQALRTQAGLYSTLPWTHGYLRQAVVRMEEDLPFEAAELGWVFSLLFVAGLGLALWDRRLHLRVAGPALFLLLLLAVQLRFDYQPFRNLLPLVPLAAAFAALPLAALRERLSPRLALDIALTGLLLATMLPTAYTMARQRRDLVDSRVEARRWLATHMRPRDRVLVLEELRFLPQELAKLTARVRIVDRPTALTLARRGRFRFFVIGDPAPIKRLPTGAFAAGRQRYQRRVSFGTEPVPPMGWWWFGNRVQIDVLDRGTRKGGRPRR